MPDASRPCRPEGAPRDWQEAFAALPQDTPPADTWRAVERRLDARRARRRVPAWLALAAAAAVVAVIAWPETSDVATPIAASAVPAGGDSSPSRVVEPRAIESRVETPVAGATEVAIREPHDDATPFAASAAPATVEPGTAEPGMARLYSESAQLEALLAVARDERAGSGSSLLLADAFDSQVAGIDAALADPALDDTRREALWQARIDLLRQATGFAGTQRLLAAQGQADALLASVD